MANTQEHSQQLYLYKIIIIVSEIEERVSDVYGHAKQKLQPEGEPVHFAESIGMLYSNMYIYHMQLDGWWL